MADDSRVHREGSRVQMIIRGQLLAEMQWQVAIELGKALVAVGRQAETHEKLHSGDPQLITDSAILIRAGAGIGLSQHPDVLAEAKKEALFSRTLRRFMPWKGIRSEEAVGTPTVVQHKPRGNGRR